MNGKKKLEDGSMFAMVEEHSPTAAVCRIRTPISKTADLPNSDYSFRFESRLEFESDRQPNFSPSPKGVNSFGVPQFTGGPFLARYRAPFTPLQIIWPDLSIIPQISSLICPLHPLRFNLWTWGTILPVMVRGLWYVTYPLELYCDPAQYA